MFLFVILFVTIYKVLEIYRLERGYGPVCSNDAAVVYNWCVNNGTLIWIQKLLNRFRENVYIFFQLKSLAHGQRRAGQLLAGPELYSILNIWKY